MRHPERLHLARLPTPIVKLERLSARVRKNIWMWRDDLTGGVEAGNKIRKLEFLAADAVLQKATRLITCGGPQSNHARATVFTARRLGMRATIVVRKPRPEAKQTFDPKGVPTANYLLDLIGGAEIELVEFADYKARGSKYDEFLARATEQSREKGERPYVVPEGGSSALGAFGYIAGVEEMLGTWRALGTSKPLPDALFAAVGSGGTLAGLHLGYEQLGLPSETIHAVNVCDSAAYFQERTEGIMVDAAAHYGLKHKQKTLSIFDGHYGSGYADATDEDLRTYAELAALEGVVLDPVYTGKAFRGMIAEIERDPRRFGDDIMFLHTGGIFGNFAYAAQYGRALEAERR